MLTEEVFANETLNLYKGFKKFAASVCEKYETAADSRSASPRTYQELLANAEGLLGDFESLIRALSDVPVGGSKLREQLDLKSEELLAKHNRKIDVDLEYLRASPRMLIKAVHAETIRARAQKVEADLVSARQMALDSFDELTTCEESYNRFIKLVMGLQIFEKSVACAD